MPQIFGICLERVKGWIGTSKSVVREKTRRVSCQPRGRYVDSHPLSRFRHNACFPALCITKNY